MAKRHKMSAKHSRRQFSKHGSKTHRRNISASGGAKAVMRGGIRL